MSTIALEHCAKVAITLEPAPPPPFTGTVALAVPGSASDGRVEVLQYAPEILLGAIDCGGTGSFAINAAGMVKFHFVRSSTGPTEVHVTYACVT